MSFTKLNEFLDSHHVKYTRIHHTPAFTAQEIAQSAHIAGRELAKTVIVKVDGEMKMVVVPANIKVDFDALKTFAKADKVELATEYEFNNRFPECELGAMPPFGNLFGMEVYLADSLKKSDRIAFNAGSHTELIKLPFKDFVDLVHPKTIKGL